MWAKRFKKGKGFKAKDYHCEKNIDSQDKKCFFPWENRKKRHRN